MSKAWEEIIKIECITGYKKGISTYENLARKNLIEKETCFDFEELYEITKNMRDETMDVFFNIASIR